MIYAEASYFQGYAFAHIAAYEEMKRVRGIRQQAMRAFNSNPTISLRRWN